MSGDQQVVARPHIERMTQAVHHRGPDGVGFHLAKNVALGHRRLSIIDLATGDQPMFSPDGDLCIVYNGEIYNYVELRTQLQAAGYHFRTQSDTEVILHLFHQQGTRALDQLDGMFAIAIWCESEQRLFLARDRFGEKPLYYWRQGGQLAFASELKSLLQHPAVQRNLDHDALGSYFAYGYIPSPQSIYRHIRKLPQAGWLHFDRNGISSGEYWTPTAAERVKGDETTLLDQLDGLLRDSTRIRLRSDVPVGAFLSGGVDSSLIVRYASELYEGSLQTFTVTFDEQSVDESQYARQVADICGTDHHELRVGDFGTDVLPDLVRQFDEPFADPSALPTYYVTRAAGDRLKVCLSGDAGDELFGGYHRYGPEPYEHQIDWIPPTIRGPLLRALSRVLPERQAGKGWLLRMGSSAVDRYLQRIWLFDPLEVQSLARQEIQQTTTGAHQAYRQLAHGMSQRTDWPLLFDQRTYLPDNILVKTDRNSMLHSLELRVPLLDHKIAEFANSLSLRRKMGAGELKHPLKALSRRYFPAELMDRRKQGFGLPLKEWFSNGPLAEQYRDLLLSRNARILEFVNHDALSGLLTAHQQGRRDLGKRLWALLWLELWLDNFPTAS